MLGDLLFLAKANEYTAQFFLEYIKALLLVKVMCSMLYRANKSLQSCLDSSRCYGL